MKLNNFFKNRRNIYFTVLIIAAFLMAGGLWEYRSILNEKKAQMELERYYASYDDDQADNSKTTQPDTSIQIIQEKSREDNGDAESIREVSNTQGQGGLVEAATHTKDTPKPGTGTAAKSTKAIPAIKIQDSKMETMVIPVFGSLCMDYSDASLIYSKTLDEWTTHSGIDIKAEVGSSVRAAMDGKVVEMRNDSQWGLTIVLDHGSGIRTIYSNLSTLDLVTLGQQVKKGDVISGVGNTALCESSEESHLHFEIAKDDKCLDPKLYLPKQSLKR